MSQPMSRTVSRPFGVPTRRSQQPASQAEVGPTQSVTNYVITPALDDTPPNVQPHAADYAGTLAGGMPMSRPSESRPLRQPATTEQRLAYIQMRNAQLAQDTLSVQPLSPAGTTYAETARNVEPSFRVPATATYDFAAAVLPPANSHARSPYAPTLMSVPPIPQALAGDTDPLPPTPPATPPINPVMTPPPQPSRSGSAIILQPPRRTSSLGVAARPEVEVEIRGVGVDRVVTIRLHAQR